MNIILGAQQQGIIIKSQKEIDIMRRAGEVAIGTKEIIKKEIQIGMTTKELDLIAENQIRSMGAIPAFKGYRGFPGTLCISINNEIVHGIPGDRKFQEGDVVSIDQGAIVVDVRNYYEGEVGKFKDAIIPDVDASVELLPEIKKLLKGKEDDKILMYCTGGIRCEKASSYLIHHGFKDVNQLNGGIIQYANDIKVNNEKSKFIGKNFVFDHRMAESITNDILSTCHICDNECDTHTNCSNQDCHILFIQCDKCSKKYNGCCSEKCSNFIKLPREEQRELFRSGKILFNAQKSDKTKPKLYELE